MTGSVGLRATRLTRGRTNQRGSCPSTMLGAPFGERWQPGTTGEAAPTASPLGVGDAACGCPTSPWKARSRRLARGRRSAGRAGSGGCAGESPAPESWQIQRVLVDNKSVAEIGDRCLPLEGLRRFGVAGTTWGSALGRSIPVTGGWLEGATRVSRRLVSYFHLSQTSRHFRPRVGMKSIEGVLDGEPLGLTRSREKRSWCGRRRVEDLRVGGRQVASVETSRPPVRATGDV